MIEGQTVEANGPVVVLGGALSSNGGLVSLDAVRSCNWPLEARLMYPIKAAAGGVHGFQHRQPRHCARCSNQRLW